MYRNGLFDFFFRTIIVIYNELPNFGNIWFWKTNFAIDSIALSNLADATGVCEVYTYTYDDDDVMRVLYVENNCLDVILMS